MAQNQTKRHPPAASSLHRWLTYYLPCLILLGFLLYVLSELFMKHLALRTIQQHLSGLPETPAAAVRIAENPAPQPVLNPGLLQAPSIRSTGSLHSYVLAV